MKALGHRFLDADDCELPLGGGALPRLARIDDTEVPASVIYVNASGLTSASPWQGVNVVITTFANGTRKIEKVNFNR